MSDTPLPVRFPFADAETGLRAGYWFLRPIEEGGFRISWVVKSTGQDHESRDRATAGEIVELFAEQINLFFAKQWAGYQELIKCTREGRNLFDRPGFRPGHARRELTQGLNKFQSLFTKNEQSLPLIQAALDEFGWPQMTSVKIPWVL